MERESLRPYNRPKYEWLDRGGKEVTQEVNDAPDGDRGHDRLGPYQRPQPKELCDGGSVPRSSSSERKTLTGNATRWNQQFKTAYTADTGGCGGHESAQTQAPESVSKNLQESVGASEPDNLSKAAEISISPSGGVPAARGEAAVTRDRRDRERRAGRSRGGAESAGWREVAEWCHATEGSGHE